MNKTDFHLMIVLYVINHHFSGVDRSQKVMKIIDLQ